MSEGTTTGGGFEQNQERDGEAGGSPEFGGAPPESTLASTNRTVAFTDDELDELSQFLFWAEDRRLEGGPWWPGEPDVIRFVSGPLAAAVRKLHDEWGRIKGIPEVSRG